MIGLVTGLCHRVTTGITLVPGRCAVAPAPLVSSFNPICAGRDGMASSVFLALNSTVFGS